jgi:hypothetical protein
MLLATEFIHYLRFINIHLSLYELKAASILLNIFKLLFKLKKLFYGEILIKIIKLENSKTLKGGD